MQVEHKTEKGTVIFVKVPDDYRDLEIYKRNNGRIVFNYFVKSSCITMELNEGDWQLIGLTSEVTEDQAKVIVPDKEIVGEYDNGLYVEDWYGYIGYIDEDNSFSNALDSFKSLMQHLKIYEVNPHEKPPTYAEQCWIDQYKNAESRTGRWIVLFKEN